jgi:hypothetical protein
MTFQLSLIFSGTGFEVLTVMRIHNAVWIRSSYGLVHGYVREHCGFLFTGHLMIKIVCSNGKPHYQRISLHGPISGKTSYPSFLEFLVLLLGGLEGWALRYGMLRVPVTDVMRHNYSSYRS